MSLYDVTPYLLLNPLVTNTDLGGKALYTIYTLPVLDDSSSFLDTATRAVYWRLLSKIPPWDALQIGRILPGEVFVIIIGEKSPELYTSFPRRARRFICRECNVRPFCARRCAREIRFGVCPLVHTCSLELIAEPLTVSQRNFPIRFFPSAQCRFRKPTASIRFVMALDDEGAGGYVDVAHTNACSDDAQARLRAA